MTGKHNSMMYLVIITGLFLSLVRAFCLPDEDLKECLKRQTTTKQTNQVFLTETVTCLGTKKDSFAFLGTCTSSGSRCKCGVSSSSLDCGSSSICCQDGGQVNVGTSLRSSSAWPLDIIQRKKGNYEYLNKQSCGISRVRFVLGGHKAQEGAFPFIVSFTQNISHHRQWKTFCGGVMISSSHVLTAAHCFDKLQDQLFDKNIRVRIGVSDLEETKKQRQSYAKIKHVFIHPKFKRRVSGYLNPFNDIAVIELHFLQGFHKTVCLPTRVDKRKENSEETAVVAGYGSTSSSTSTKPEYLVYAHVNAVQSKECRKKYSEFVENIPGNVYISNNNVLCAGDNKTDACSGDSGSPLLWVDDLARWSVAGIVSFGPSVCGQDVPGAYTKVESYLDWIENMIT